MKTLNLGIILDQGADFNYVIGINGDDATPINLTGYSFLSEMRASTDPASPVVAEFIFTIQNQTTNAGQVLWSLPNATTADLITSVAAATNYKRLTTPFVFDVKMLDTVGNVTRIIQGIVLVSPQATMESF
jgi:hypothetical protein